jgi:hypothetical protein
MSKYLIIYDNHCGICSTGAKAFTRLGVLNDEATMKLSDVEKNALACNVNPQQACDEMAVVNKQTSDVSYGVDAYALLVAERSPFFGKVFQNKWIKKMLRPCYKFIASNRRIVAPLKTGAEICQPRLHKGHRLLLIVFMAVFSAVITFQKGELLEHTALFGFLNGFKLLQVTGVGWILTGFLYRQNDKWDYWGHLAIIAGCAIFIQSLALIGYHYFPHVAWILGSMGVSDILMVVMHYKRMKKLDKPQSHTLRWWLLLHLTAGLSIAQYYFFS